MSQAEIVRTDENERGKRLHLCFLLHIRSGKFPCFKEMISMHSSTPFMYRIIVFSSLISGARLWKADLWLHHSVVPLIFLSLMLILFIFLIMCACKLYYFGNHLSPNKLLNWIELNFTFTLVAWLHLVRTEMYRSLHRTVFTGNRHVQK